jgi:ribosomal protein L29
MADEPENLTLKLLREMRDEMREGFAELRGELKAFRDEVAATDTENAKILETITGDIADLKTIFVDVQARVIRHEKRVKTLEKARPEARD